MKKLNEEILYNMDREFSNVFWNQLSDRLNSSLRLFAHDKVMSEIGRKTRLGLKHQLNIQLEREIYEK